MAMKKSEMEYHHAEYDRHMGQARVANQQGLFRQAVQLAMDSWDHIDGMMQYDRKYEDQEYVRIEAIEIVLRYAPLLFDSAGLDKIRSFLKDNPRIAKKASGDLPKALETANQTMWDAHRMWDLLEQHGGWRQDELRRTLDGSQDRWRLIAETWERMGLLRRTPESGSFRLALSTRLGEVVSGKCSKCGSVAEAPKAILLEQTTCPACRVKSWFVLLATECMVNMEEQE